MTVWICDKCGEKMAGPIKNANTGQQYSGELIANVKMKSGKAVTAKAQVALTLSEQPAPDLCSACIVAVITQCLQGIYPVEKANEVEDD